MSWGAAELQLLFPILERHSVTPEEHRDTKLLAGEELGPGEGDVPVPRLLLQCGHCHPGWEQGMGTAGQSSPSCCPMAGQGPWELQRER